jgi:hypothetical protein
MNETEFEFDDGMTDGEFYARMEDDEYGPDDGMTDVEADADTLASAGWGTDEDYGSFGDDVLGSNW